MVSSTLVLNVFEKFLDWFSKNEVTSTVIPWIDHEIESTLLWMADR